MLDDRCFILDLLSICCYQLVVVFWMGSTITDRDKLTTNKLTVNKLTVNNVDWLRRAILNIFLLSPQPFCPNPHFVTKSLQRNHGNKTVGSWSVSSRSVCRGQLTWLVLDATKWNSAFKIIFPIGSDLIPISTCWQSEWILIYWEW